MPSRFAAEPKIKTEARPGRLAHWVFLALTLTSAPAWSATIVVVSDDGPGEGYNDPTVVAPVGGNPQTTLGAQRLFATQNAVQVWANLLASSVTITVRARFDPLPCTTNSGSLGRAGTLTVHQNFAGAPRANTLYPAALANALANTDLNGPTPEIEAIFNASVDNNNACLNGVDYYYGVNGSPPGNDVDLASVVLHEMTHGLGMFTAVDLPTGARFMNTDDAYMVHLEDHSTGTAWPAMSDLQRRQSAIDRNDLHWTGTNVVAASGILAVGAHPSGHVEMYAPLVLNEGSSVSHFSDRLAPDELLEPVRGSPTTDPSLAIPLLVDLGWTLLVPTVCGDGIIGAGESCDDGNTVGGDCCSATCTFEVAGSACGDTSTNACDGPDQCDGAGMCETNRTPAGAVCRPAAGTCDVAESCDGVAPTCPADVRRNAGFECRAPNGVCDVAEVCTGASTQCPADVRATAGTMCRPQNGVCDAAEVCTGNSPACPPDIGANAGTVCRPQDGLCDAAEVCTGNSPACPPDIGANAGTVCRIANGPCDVVEACDGINPICPPNGAATAGVTCRPQNGACDEAEVCDGVRTTCPVDRLAPRLTTCRPATNICDREEFCTGGSRLCPIDRAAPPGTVCRPSVGPCDAVELCNDTTVSCPPDTFAAAGTTCRASTGVCDIPESCDGRSVGCPSDVVRPRGEVCRPPLDVCDAPEVCDGTLGRCPNDVAVLAGTPCRPASGPCDRREDCDGVRAACPADVFLGSGAVCRPAADACDAPEACNGQQATCPADGRAADGVPCGGGDACVESRACLDGICTTGAAIVCEDGDPCTADGCADGRCTTMPLPMCGSATVPPPLALVTAEPVGCGCANTNDTGRRSEGAWIGLLGFALFALRRRRQGARAFGSR